MHAFKNDEIDFSLFDGYIIPRRDFLWPKTCACGNWFTPDEWAALPFAYFQENIDHHGKRLTDYDLEGRMCPCGSSIAIPIKPIRG